MDPIATARAEFLRLAREYTLIPVCREVLADLETPVSAFMKLCGDEPAAFLLESVEGGERLGRHSFLGARPLATFIHRDGVGRVYTGEAAASHIELATPVPLPDGPHPPGRAGDPLGQLRELLGRYRVAPPLPVPDRHGLGRPAGPLPRFFGGAVGYLAYDAVRFYERLPSPPPDELGLPDAAFIIPELVVAFDHLRHRLLLGVMAEPGPDPEAAFDRAVALLEAAQERLRGPVPVPGRLDVLAGPIPGSRPLRVEYGCTREAFTAAVRRAQAYIRAGEVFQVVLSQRLRVPVRARPLDIYRALRSINPSPYLFYLSYGDLKLIGSSPEMLLRVEGGVAETRPIAGTVPRGSSESEDREREARLLADEKERAEHLMLVDLGRNDLGRVAAYGTVEVPELMRVERYSHVIHLVSSVRGRLAPGRDALDALAAVFPAGTLTGAPKVRAMEIIDELEPVRRGPYGGAVGYCGFDGTLDTCIGIRMLILKGSTAYLQAGAGVVADSDPDREYEESLQKARHLLRTLEMAEEGLA
ncbi:MAG: anthranilate synthase component I family protein [Bacillota bacterium]